MKLSVYPGCADYWAPFYGVHRWDQHLNTRPGTYSIVAKNVDLAHMQGAPNGSVHMTCVVDDFGTLVRVPA